MSDFVNRTFKVFDTLTLTVLLEQGDLDYTMVEYWDCMTSAPPIKRRSCLACLCKRFGYSADATDNRAGLLRSVKNGRLQVERAWLRAADNDCGSCDAKPSKVVNAEWLKELL